MQLPSAARDRLMLFSSVNCTPVTPDFFTRSEPARSTRNKQPQRMCASPAPVDMPSLERFSKVMMNTAWLRLE